MKTGNSHKITGAVLCLCAGAVLAGCSKESDFGGLAETNLGIGFEVNLAGDQEEAAQTRSTLGTTAFNENLSLRTVVTENRENPFAAARSRATEVTTDAFYDTFGAYTYVYKSSESWSDSPSAKLYIEGETVTQSGSLWTFNPTQYWPSTDYRLTFFAYAPASLGEVTDGSLAVSLNSSNLPQIAYTVPSGYAEQKDLVVATATDQTKSESSVPLDFAHILTAVQVKCGSVPEGTISSISFSGIQSQGTYDLAEGNWTLGSSTASYAVSRSVTATDGAAILTGDYTLMLLPQSLGEDAAVTVEYTPTDGDKTTLTASLSGQEWEAGTTVTYLLSWEEEEKEIEIDYSASGSINSHGYVDLGLSVMWATCNVGADSPADCGNYYAWGEITEPEDGSYSSTNCRLYGVTVTGDTIGGNPLFDAATANWEGDWRLPTRSEWTELKDNTTRTWTTQTDSNGNTVNGYKVTGSNGNSIFLPSTGYYTGTTFHDSDTDGYYWCSTSYGSNGGYESSAYYFRFSTSTFTNSFNCYRYYGQSVRPVIVIEE